MFHHDELARELSISTTDVKAAPSIAPALSQTARAEIAHTVGNKTEVEEGCAISFRARQPAFFLINGAAQFTHYSHEPDRSY
jgi:hypothetical protein